VDLQEIHDFIARDNANAADKFIDRLESRCRFLVGSPKIGRRRDEISAGLRSITEGNYLILYRAVTRGVFIARVLHSARDVYTLLAADACALLEPTEK
jgi:toxin ParE1/3/4